jgi:hypothetical protein
VEFYAQMSREDILRALKQLLPNQFKEPPEVATEFAGAVAPAEDAERTIAGRLMERVLTNEDLDVGFGMDRRTAMHNLRGLWRRLRREEHERQPPHVRPRLRQPPLPAPDSEEYLDAQGLKPIGLEGEALGDYLAQLEEAVRTWWKTVGPADNLPYQHGRLVDPSGPADGERWPSDSFLTSQVQEGPFGPGAGRNDICRRPGRRRAGAALADGGEELPVFRPARPTAASP